MIASLIEGVTPPPINKAPAIILIDIDYHNQWCEPARVVMLLSNHHSLQRPFVGQLLGLKKMNLLENWRILEKIQEWNF